jgi:hypothetical protein
MKKIPPKKLKLHILPSTLLCKEGERVVMNTLFHAYSLKISDSIVFQIKI